MRSFRGALCLALSVGLPQSAVAASIGLFSAPDCSSCNLSIAAGETKTVYVMASTHGLGWAISSAAFRADGLPEGWTWTFQPTQNASFSYGDPLGATGAALAFGTAMSGGCVELYRVRVTATSDVQDASMQIEAMPSDTIGCPAVALACGGACDVRECVDGGSLLINADQDCQVATQERTWAGIKNLYR